MSIWKQSCISLALGVAAFTIHPLDSVARNTSAVTGQSGQLKDWEPVSNPFPRNAVTESEIARIVQGMTLRQKIGQMTQPDIRWITPEQARQFYIGSILNGGGAWPGMNKQASVADWAALSDRYYRASMSTDAKTQIPIIWGTDAVHGHNNVVGATIFPHNIGLGAARDPALIFEIAQATARAVRATGITWAFAPTLAVVQNQRWGRSYEGFSSDPRLVRSYGYQYVKGLQGAFADDGNVVASAKHFIGDGGTFGGVDQGENRATLDEMINVHAQGYYGALSAGAATVMASYNSWNDVAANTNHGKMHGNKALLTDVLKGKLGFDGFVVSDWNAIEQVPGCARARCPQAINAGIDMVMVPENWQEFIENMVKDVESGAIATARIDDAVSRILRVKYRSGLFAKNPATSGYAGKVESISAKALARQAVSQSLVLLKNNGGVLPLRRGKPVLVVGKSADDFSSQTGGWSITWQGTENTNADFPNGATLLAALRDKLGGSNVEFSPTADAVDVRKYAAVIAAIGETPYAEGKGDIRLPAVMTHSRRYPEDLAALRKVSGKGVPVVTVLYAGRTVYANDLINLSDAFVAAWLPGTEAGGIADVLVRTEKGKIDRTFTGKLPFAWPAGPCPAGTPAMDKPLFAVGYGLTYRRAPKVPTLKVETSRAECDTSAH